MAKNAQVQGTSEQASFDAAWKNVRGDSDIQFAAAEFKPPEVPQWWQDFLKWLGEVLGPVGEMLVTAWPVLRIVLLVLLAVGVLTLLWVILAPYIEEWRGRKPKSDVEEWLPEQSVARQWLDEADALAGKGQYDEAAHLLLFRSIEDIEKRRPELLRPSNTSREIERFESLPEKARNMFAVIASHVERGVFGATPIGEAGWLASRNAYGEFALKDSWKASS
ncbi:hypothetical protein [Parasphingorhabdus halotolerans]|uniref:DUF4129 domain-containing protein n=1 Tax=Parasphingorhabdus halotolerans TaxID=2725558 RepID=A0A6H2DP20_9SPHN|nr:hypothetical protein [Parasphingorhabdus halotolerans]QJB69501.1 hypothetical protein HF685_09590 [Parasphingorhabdus halotolerans]